MLTVIHNRRGRPRNPVRSDDDRRGLQIWHRVKSDAVKIGLDYRLGSQLSRLGLMGELTDRQVQAGFELAGVYGRFERMAGTRRSVASPSYMRAARSEAPDHDRDIDIQGRFDQLQKELARSCPPVVRDVIEELCVNDRCVASASLPAIRRVLDRLSSVPHGGVAPRPEIAISEPETAFERAVRDRARFRADKARKNGK